MDQILFVSGLALGHVGRLLTIADALSAQGGMEAQFAVPEGIACPNPAESAGYATHILPFDKTTVTSIRSYADALETLLGSRKWRCIVLDMNLLRIASAVRWPDGVPRLIVSNAFICLSGDSPTQQDIEFRRMGSSVNAIRAERGLPPLESASALFDADLICLADPPQICDLYPARPANVLPCGPCNWEYENGDASPPDAPECALLISVGSTGPQHLTGELVEQLIEWSDSRGAAFLGSSRTKLDDFNGVVAQHSMAPIRPFLDEAPLVLTHGGTGSTYMALAAGKPVSILPHHRNQLILGQLLERLGVALLLDERESRYRSHEWPDFAMLETGARKFARTMGAFDGPSAIAGHIRSLL